MNNGNSMTMDYFRRGFFSRVVSVLTTFFFTFVFYLNPATKAMADELTKDEKREAALEALQEATPEQKLGHRLDKLRDKIVLQMPQAKEDKAKHANWLTKAKQAILSDMPVSDDDAKELKKLQASIDSAYQESIANFEKDADTILSNGNGKALSLEAQKLVRERHAQALKSVKEKFKATQDQLAAVIAADSVDTQQQALDTLSKSLAKTQFKRSHTPATPDHLPWGTSEGKVREPVETKQDLHAALGTTPTDNVQLAMAETGSSVASVVMAEALAAATINITTELGESPDVQITPEIRALARTLHNNSTEIYAWVHNNIRFIPSHGSIQGSQYTLETKQGNAIDTASLLIALLRASNIPSHYAYGTVEIPIDQVMNWVGGVASPLAVQDLLSQGGIPNILVKKNGVLASFRMEHVWVEAWVDYSPSRGKKAKIGDTWVPMDASFKQYEFSQKLDVKSQIATEANALSGTLQSKAVINTTEGWAQNVPQVDIDLTAKTVEDQIKTFVDQQDVNMTLNEALGIGDISIIPPRPLAAGLPYQRIVTSSSFAEVPDNLRYKFKYSLATTINGYANDPLFVVELPTVKLAGKKLAVSFKPSTKADEDVIASRVPAPEPDGSIDPNKLPSSLPGYMIKLTAEFTTDSSTIASAPVGAMGEELHEELGFWSPKNGWEVSENKPINGEYRAIGLDLQGMGLYQAEKLKAKLESTKAKLVSGDKSQLTNLTRHEMTGDLLFGTIFNYFAMNDVQDRVTAQSTNIINYRLPSYGVFNTKLTPHFWFGIPRNVDFGGVQMDIDRMAYQTVSRSNIKSEVLNYAQIVGSRGSAMEHLVPEQNLSTENAKMNGVSAVKALAIAGSQGQKIWTISSNNIQLAMTKITIDQSSKDDIRNAVGAGKVVTAHEAPINFGGWIGEGYIISDPQTGSAAYMIGGGQNGSDTVGDAAKKLGWAEFTSPIPQLSPQMALMANYIGYSISYIKGYVKCHEEVAKTIAFIVLIILLAILLDGLTLGAGTAPIAAMTGAILGGASASVAAAEEDGGSSCKMDCQKASKYQLKQAGIYGREHEFKTWWSAIPNSSFDICACADYSIVIYTVNKCGYMDSESIITDERWDGSTTWEP